MTHLWGHKMGDMKAAVLRLGQGISISDNRVYAASHKGEVVALDLTNGRVLWHTKTGAPLSGGTLANTNVSSGGRDDVAGTASGTMVLSSGYELVSSGGTASVITEPAARYAPSPISMGATSVALLPTKARSPMRVRCFWKPS